MFPSVPSGLVGLAMMVLALGMTCFADDRGEANRKQNDEIARWVRELGNARFEVREKASKRLAEIGEPALPALREAAKSEDPEVRARAQRLIEQIMNIGRDAVRRYLDRIPGTERAQIEPVDDPALARSFPSRRFHAVRFRMFPVARPIPAALQPSNLFVTDARGNPERLEDTQALETFGRQTLPPVDTDAKARDAVASWLRLVEEFHQDGFYKFQVPEGSIQLIASDGSRTASGKALVTQGGSGAIDVTLQFDAAGALVHSNVTAKIKRGVRPICQATKLLDPDPIVRKMAEQDLLVMGRAAKSYLDEQRPQAGPNLRAAIDRIWEQIVAEDP
jgi:hypothetical protein